MSRKRFWSEQRTSARFGFILHLFARSFGALLSLWWSRVLVEAMGPALNGTFITFQRFASLGGLGDLGLGTVVGMNVGRHLGAKTHGELHEFLGSARAMFTALTLGIFFLGVALSPFLPRWLGFIEQPNSGSMTLLFVLGSCSAAFMIAASYIQNVNYGAGNITWPIIPTFLLTHLGIAAHWILARAGAPLTVQYLPYLTSSFLTIVVIWWLVKVSHPDLAVFRPLYFRIRAWLPMIGQTFWAYLWSIGYFVYSATDTILINKGFGPEIVNGYYFNGRLSELAFFVVVTAGSVSLPKMTHWLGANTPEDRGKALNAVHRLLALQTFLGTSAAIVYLGVNQWFVIGWYGPEFKVPLEWQGAFALSLAVTSGGSAAMQVSSRCGENGLRYSGIVVGITAAINLVLSLVSMKLGSILGIALATVLAQSFFSLIIGRYVCLYFGLNFLQWAVRSWLLPLFVVAGAYMARALIAPSSVGIAVTAALFLGLLALASVGAGINAEFLRHEWAVVAAIMRRRRDS